LVGFKEPRTRVCGSFYSELGRRVEKLRSVSEAAPTRRIPRTNFQAVSREAARLASDGEGAPIAILRRDAATCPA
jgi:hypothetical protein